MTVVLPSAARRAAALSDEALLAECDVEVFVASGPGGQHRNKTESGVRILHRPTEIRVAATERRSQIMNREVALERLRAILRRLSHVPKPRRPTKPTKGSKERRLSEKKRAGERKAGRQRPPD